MVVEFASGRLTPEVVRQRMMETTAEQLAALTNDPAFHAWQAQKAQKENRARIATNLLAVVACVALAVTMALLKPAATAQVQHAAPVPAAVTAYTPDATPSEPVDTMEALLWADAAASPAVLDLLPSATATAVAAGSPLTPLEVQSVLEMAQARVQSVQAEADAAQDAAADLALRLRVAEEEREAAAARLTELEAAAAAQQAEARESEVAAAELLAHLTAQLQSMRQEVAAAEAAAAAAASLAEATASAAAALLEAPPADAETAVQPQEVHAAPAVHSQIWFGPHPEGALLAELEAAQMVCHQPSSPFSNATMPLPQLPAGRATAFAQPLALYAAGAASVAAALLLMAVLLHIRGRRRLVAEASRTAVLAARLKEVAFAKDTAEQSLGMLERELQQRMKQLEEVQQAAADASSPKIGTAPAPPPPTSLGLHTPGRGELPPPPASLVEKFLRDHNFLAVQHEQMEEWLEMEQQFGEMQAALDDMQAALADKDARIAAYEQDLSAKDHGTLEQELRSREDQLAQVKAWLDEAQEELLETQAALQEQEAECRRVSSQLEVVQSLAHIQEPGAEGREGALVRQNLELVAQLQSVTAAYEALQEQLASSAANEARELGAAFDAVRPGSATSVPGTPADLSREVQSCLEMMRATRAQLADRLAHSQGVCEAMIADCQGQGSRTFSGANASGESCAESAVPPGPGEVDQADGDESPAPFGSPATVEPVPAAMETNNPLFEEEVEGWEGEELSAGTPAAPDAAPAEEEQEQPAAVLGSSTRHNTTPSPTTSKSPPAGECTPNSFSMRTAWQAANVRVAEAKEQCNCWDLMGFVRELGFQIGVDGSEGEGNGEEGSAPMDRAAFEALRERAEAALAAAAAEAATSSERALAGQAMQVLKEWEFPVQRIATPPPSPFWRMFGGLRG